MRRLLLAALLSLMAIRPVAAQSIEVPSEVKVDMPGLVVVRATKMDADDVRWYPVGSPKLQTFPSDVLAVKPGTFVGITTQPGVYKIGVIAAKDVAGKAKMSEPVYITITVGTPVPIPPTPPGPGPVPPTPTPTPIKALKILFVTNEKDKTKLPAGQINTLYGVPFREWLNSVTPMGPDGKTHDWNIWDQSTDASAMPQIWQDWLKRPHASLPWVILGDESGVAFEGPVPADPTATKTLIQKFVPTKSSHNHGQFQMETVVAGLIALREPRSMPELWSQSVAKLLGPRQCTLLSLRP
jgi:hypothetical protein